MKAADLIGYVVLSLAMGVFWAVLRATARPRKKGEYGQWYGLTGFY